VTEIDPYELLGVSRTATTKQIRAAYVARARTAHPDIVGGRGLDVMRALNDAWAVLKDARRRADYDAASRAQPGTVEGATSGRASGAGATAGAAGAVAGRPFWTGAMGKPPGRPSGPVLGFGIFAGWSIGEVARRDRGYLQWLRDRPEARAIRPDIERILDPAADS
jgi:curved DNA-binding protein CbpA